MSEGEVTVICPTHRVGLPCFDLTCVLKCRRRLMMEVSQDDMIEAEATEEEVRLAILNSCIHKDCKKRVGLDKTIPAKFCRSHNCRLLTNDYLCMLGGNRLKKKKAGRLSFDRKETTLRLPWKSSGWTYRKVS